MNVALALAAASFACAAAIDRPAVSAVASLAGILLLVRGLDSGSRGSHKVMFLLPLGVVAVTWGQRMVQTPDLG